MKIGYLGGIVPRGKMDRVLKSDPETRDGHRSIHRASHEDRELFLRVQGSHLAVSSIGNTFLLLRGYTERRDRQRPPNPARDLEEVGRHYRDHGGLPIDLLEGSYTLAVLDGDKGTVLLYRNLVGTGFTYYAETNGGLVFASNLADLVDSLHVTPPPNRAMLPAYFLYRYVPGRETLFEGVYRLMPGELLTFDAQGLVRTQETTFANLEEPHRNGRDAVDRVDEMLGRVVTDCSSLRPGTGNLLSGGVDSSYLQALWNKARRDADVPPTSFAVTVEHPESVLDSEYADSAAKALRTRHMVVRADRPYEEYMLDTISSTGETPNHVQGAYFGMLARFMVARGFTTGLCGEAGDAVFGFTTANQIQNAAVIRGLIPASFLRRCGEALARRLNRERWRYYFHLADHLEDLEDLEHPVNRQAAFADWPSVRACFGEAGLASAASYRRALLDHYQVPRDPMIRLHAANFLTSSMDSASLWTTLFNRAGGDLLCPFLDSRLLRVAVNIDPRYRFPFRKPKEILKRALARYVGKEMAYRQTLGFGQPIFEWLAPGGQLRPWVERIGDHGFVDKEALNRAKDRPNWFLYSLLCYDLWHRLFIAQTLPRTRGGSPSEGLGLPLTR
jgi:asparagine synthase (glutamine-hydrolysing)